MYKNLETKKEATADAESTPENSCFCVCKGGVEEENSDAPAIDQAALYNVDYYDPGGE